MWHPVCKVSDIAHGGMKAVRVGEAEVVLIRTEAGEIYALRNRCPHKFARLSDGSLGSTVIADKVGEYKPCLKGKVIRCPWHSWEFSVESGHCLADGDVRVRSYRVKVQDGVVYVERPVHSLSALK